MVIFHTYVSLQEGIISYRWFGSWFAHSNLRFDGAFPIHVLVFWKPGSRLSYQRLPGLLWSEELKSFRDFRPLVGQENVVAVAFWWVAVSSRQEFTIPAEKSWGNGSRSCIINVAMENFPVFFQDFPVETTLFFCHFWLGVFQPRYRRVWGFAVQWVIRKHIDSENLRFGIPVVKGGCYQIPWRILTVLLYMVTFTINIPPLC